jgi:hypothetical protein
MREQQHRSHVKIDPHCVHRILDHRLERAVGTSAAGRAARRPRRAPWSGCRGRWRAPPSCQARRRSHKARPAFWAARMASASASSPFSRAMAAQVRRLGLYGRWRSSSAALLVPCDVRLELGVSSCSRVEPGSSPAGPQSSRR